LTPTRSFKVKQKKWDTCDDQCEIPCPIREILESQTLVLNAKDSEIDAGALGLEASRAACP